MAIDRRSAPIMTLSLASSVVPGDHATVRARRYRGGLADQVGQVGAREAGGVLRGRWSRPRPLAARGTFFRVDAQDSFRPTTLGIGHHHRRRRRDAAGRDPGRSGRLVAAIRMMPSLASKPSISTSNWFSACSRSSLPPPRPALATRWRPTASISSMKIMQARSSWPVRTCRACGSRRRRRTFPRSRSRNGEEVHRWPHRPRISVLPVPGGP